VSPIISVEAVLPKLLALPKRWAPGAARNGEPQPDPRSAGDSVPGRFNSLIADFISLFCGFNSLFGSTGNLSRRAGDINHLPDLTHALDGLESGFSQYLPADQGPGII